MLFFKDMSDTLPDEKVTVMRTTANKYTLCILGCYSFCVLPLSASIAIEEGDSSSHCTSKKLEKNFKTYETAENYCEYFEICTCHIFWFILEI